MVSFAEGLPPVLASLAALVVGFISLAVEAPPGVLALRVLAAYIVFWGFGFVIRAILGDAARASQWPSPEAGIPAIPPGTPVSTLLGDDTPEEA